MLPWPSTWSFQASAPQGPRISYFSPSPSCSSQPLGDSSHGRAPGPSSPALGFTNQLARTPQGFLLLVFPKPISPLEKSLDSPRAPKLYLLMLLLTLNFLRKSTPPPDCWSCPTISSPQPSRFLPAALSKVSTVAPHCRKRGAKGGSPGTRPQAQPGFAHPPCLAASDPGLCASCCRFPAGHKQLHHGAGLGTQCPVPVACVRLQPHSR